MTLIITLLLMSTYSVNIESVEFLMQTKDYAGVVTTVDELLKANASEADRLLYLKALALYYDKRYELSLDTVAEILSKYPNSEWNQKAIYLKVQNLISLKKFSEAEDIYNKQAEKLLSTVRKEELANIYIQVAEGFSRKPGKYELDAPQPDYNKAYSLYSKALELEIGTELRDEIKFRLARMKHLSGDYNQAIQEYQKYLEEFDPDWIRSSSSSIEYRGTSKVATPGKHRYEARYYLAEAQLSSGQNLLARFNIEDLLKFMPVSDESLSTLRRNARYSLIRTYHIPDGVNENELPQAVRLAEEFVKDFPNDHRAFSLSYQIGQAYQNVGRTEEAIKAYKSLLEMKYDPNNLETSDEEPRDVYDKIEQMFASATYMMGELLFSQRRYDEATEAWGTYIARFPNGANWKDAQLGIVNCQFQRGLDLLTQERYDEAIAIWNSFLEKYPLDDRTRQIMFIYGQIHYHNGEILNDEEEYRKAIAQWENLVNKYPETEESSLALFRIGQVYEEKLKDFEKAIESYRKLTWGPWVAEAQKRIKEMTEKKLGVVTERIFRTNEKARVKVTLRNIEKFKISIYKLDMESYWRKMHKASGVEDLDIVLISPDRTIEYALKDYSKYKLYEEWIEVPMDGAGVCAVHIGEEDLEATTLVIRSDIDAIIKTSKRQILVFAQDMINDRPVPEAKVLVSDGSKIVAEGLTGGDGVFQAELKDTEEASDITALIIKDKSVAVGAMDVSSLELSIGLHPRGYIYTNKNVYLPGQTVYIKGIIRDVKGGIYVAPAGVPYQISVTDPLGRTLRSETIELSEFGTFNLELALDENATIGTYQVTATSKNDESKVFTGQFLVQQYKLETVKVNIEFPRSIYFRGERVDVTFIAQYYYGQPLKGRSIRYWLPDGRSFVGQTDDEGKLKAEFDTTPMQPGTELVFTATIEGENLTPVRGTVVLAEREFSIKVMPSTDVVISGEPFDVYVETIGADKAPIGTDLTISVYRQVKLQPHPILSGVPWIADKDIKTSEVKTYETKVSTDKKSGKGKVSLKLEEGGEFIIRATGMDRFGQVVEAKASVTVSDDKDEVKLRIFSEKPKFKVGEHAKVRIYSRIRKEGQGNLTLLTFEGEKIIDYKVMRLISGWNELDVPITNDHFPNFHLSASSMAEAKSDGHKKFTLVNASKNFEVERELKISIELKEIYEPGSEVEVQLTTRDQLDNPISAEVSLSLVEQALFDIYPSSLPPIVKFFNEGIYRDLPMQVVATCTFSYHPPTRKVIKELIAEEERLLKEAGELAEKDRASAELRYYAPIARKPVEAEGLEALASKKAETVDLATGRGYGAPEGVKLREELVEGGFWQPSIVTGVDGKAAVKIKLPEKITRWRLISIGCTTETLVGESFANTTTRKDFFVEAKLPSILTEGDKIRVVVRTHNLTSFAGEISLSMVLKMDERVIDLKKQVNVKANDVTAVIFDPVEVSFGRECIFEISAKAGNLSDHIIRTVPIRPWGMEYADVKSGISSGDETLSLQLPSGQNYKGKVMDIAIGPRVNRLIFDLALGPIFRIANPSMIVPPRTEMGSDLLAVSYAIRYAKGVGATHVDINHVNEHAKRLISRIVSSQNEDGGWGWFGPVKGSRSDIYVTSMTFWALVEAQNEGLNVDPMVIEKASSFLSTAFTRVEQDDDNAKAVILHALSMAGNADFAYVNRLYRNRNRMGPLPLAYTCLTLINMDRKEIAEEIIDILSEKKLDALDLNTVALTLLAVQRVKPTSPMVKQYVDYLLSKQISYEYYLQRSKGPVVAALSTYYAKTQFAKSDYRLKVVVNDEVIKEIEVKGEQGLVFVPVPERLIKDGINVVTLDVEGTASYYYAVKLRGFSPEIKDPMSWAEPNVESRKYYHEPLEYKGKQIAHSNMEVTQLADGSRTHVSVNIKEGSLDRYIVITEYLPSGTMLVADTLSGNYQHYEVGNGFINIYFLPNQPLRGYRYQLASYVPGTYKVLPTVIRDYMKIKDMRIGQTNTLEVLAPGEEPKEKYKMNNAELFGLGKAYFDDGNYQDAMKMLEELYEKDKSYNQKETSRMLLWIYTDKRYYNARKVVEHFEILRERFPELYIPFEKITVVGQAYRDMGEFERAYLVHKATIDASYSNDSNISAVLQDEGLFMNSVNFQENLWKEYPDTPQVISSYFAISQALYAKAKDADKLQKEEKKIKLSSKWISPLTEEITKVNIWKKTALMLSKFLMLYPEDPLADDATFSMANVLFDLGDYSKVVSLCEQAIKSYPNSSFGTSFQYMQALGLFWQRKFDDAVKVARLVAEGESKDRDLARYIIGQIYHAQGKPEMAIEWYSKVRDIYPDADQSISYFEEKKLSMEEVVIFRPNEEIKIKLKYRNIVSANLQIYKVDLMKLYLREKDLSKISQIHLAGIEPELSMDVMLGDGKDYVDKEEEIPLITKEKPKYDEGAYLIMCRGDELFSSSLILVTPLSLEVQEDPETGTVRVNVKDVVESRYKEGVHVKVIGSMDKAFKSGNTDLRGVFVAEGVRGMATIIARDGTDRYAFYRGKQSLGYVEQADKFIQAPPMEKKLGTDYRTNIDMLNQSIQSSNIMQFDQMRRRAQKGVQVQSAY